ncbi:MAG: tRNA (adenosine(37)-N6)-dimethylallyltransferase MiaA [Epsilonproteobacteria bacterium]|nr:tRNA (adenosine(37)-N6)-dimethylallyltransferase MiaA [Campylobacterota bacterium]
MFSFKQIALIGPTASGKTALAIEYAKKNSANILSLDSLAIYKEIDIVSAKPTIEERNGVKHFGIDVIYPNEPFDVTIFMKLYQEAKAESIKEGKGLVIVGGTSFYLKSLINGISPMPTISDETYQKSSELLCNIEEAHHMLSLKDSEYMKNIEPTDYYRIEKMLNLYFETELTPTEYFKTNPPQPTITEPLPIYEIDVDRELLRERIKVRTKKMIEMGLIDEIFYLEKTYTKAPNCMKAIGIKETLDYFDGVYSKEELIEKIIINTARLAKRQRTFNNSQFLEKVSLPLNELEELLMVGEPTLMHFV